jgi:hypothetical protein
VCVPCAQCVAKCHALRTRLLSVFVLDTVMMRNENETFEGKHHHNVNLQLDKSPSNPTEFPMQF